MAKTDGNRIGRDGQGEGGDWMVGEDAGGGWLRLLGVAGREDGGRNPMKGEGIRVRASENRRYEYQYYVVYRW